MLTFSANIDEATKERTNKFFTRTRIISYSNKCRELLAQGIDLHARDSDGDSLLHLAAIYGGAEYTQLFLEHGADIHAQNNEGKTPLHIADESASIDHIPLLLAKGANIWAEANHNNTADITEIIAPHCERVLEKVKGGKLEKINATQDLYHLALVMKPNNPKDIPHPKEFIRILFQQYLPHEPKFNAMYEEIFSHSRPPAQDLKAAREAAKGRGVVL